MKAPFVGLPATTENDRCGFSADLDRPRCDQRSVVHLAVDSPGWGVVGLPACEDHAPTARATGTLLGDHPFGALCVLLTGECWS